MTTQIVPAPTKTDDAARSAAIKVHDVRMKQKETAPLKGDTVSSSHRSSQRLNEARYPQGEFDADESPEVVVAARKAKGGGNEAARHAVGKEVGKERSTKSVS